MKFIKKSYTKFKKLSFKKKVAVIGIPLLVVLVLIPLLTYAYFARDIANEERLMNRGNTGVILLDRNGEEFYRAYNANASASERLTLEQMPEHVPAALIATEDRSFYEHGGYSIRATLAALYGNILSRDIRRYGGSTITQQLAKNALLSHDKTYFRKYQELSLAIAIERNYEKDNILEMYLNSVYFGEGAFGIEDAAQTYFGKSAKDLEIHETSMLIGILPAPSAWSPISGDIDAAKERQYVVLTSMVATGDLSEDETEEIFERELALESQTAAGNVLAIHFAEMVLDELKERYGEERIARSGYRVVTTLDTSWQEIAESSVSNHISQISATGARNGAAVVIDPKTGEVRALVGSADWTNEDFGKVNMATALRQPGSSFKPIYFTEALARRNITPATIIRDEATNFGGNYRPQNFDRSYRGDVTTRRALANSLNIPAVKVMQELGVGESVNAANRLGINSIDSPDHYGLSLALGTAETRLIELTNAYAAYANGGTQYELSTVKRIQDKYDKTIYTNSSTGNRVVDEGASFLISSILSDERARAEVFGNSLSIGRQAAVKTGTTENNRDALTIGYTPSIAVGVWVGNNENEPMSGIGGSMGAAPIWRNIMINALANSSVETFQPPSSVEPVLVCTNGLRAPKEFKGTYTEYFLRGTVPTEYCDAPEPREQKEPKEDEEAKPPEEDEEIELPDDDGEEDDDDDEDAEGNNGGVGGLL